MSQYKSLRSIAVCAGILMAACGSQGNVTALLPGGSDATELVVTPVGDPIGHGYRVAQFDNGNLLFSAFYDQQLLEITPSGTLINRIDLDFRPTGVEIASDGDIVVLDYDGGRVVRLNGDGSPDTDVLPTPLGGFSRPIDIVFDTGFFVTVELLDPSGPTGRVQFFTPDGAEASPDVTLTNVYPTGIAVASPGDYVIADFSSSSSPTGGLIRFNADTGQTSIPLPGYTGRPSGVATRTSSGLTTVFFTSYGSALNAGQLFRVPLTNSSDPPVLLEDTTDVLSDLDANPFGLFKADGDFNCFITNFFNNNINEQPLLQSNECGAYVESATANVSQLVDGSVAPLFRPDPPASVLAGDLDSSVITAFREQNTVLTTNLLVDITEPGLYDELADLGDSNGQPFVIPAGTSVTSVFITVDNGSSFADEEIVFSSEVLGIQAISAALDSGETTGLGAPGTTYPFGTAARGLEIGFGPGNFQDIIELETDRRTLILRRTVTGTGANGVDQIRVILSP